MSKSTKIIAGLGVVAALGMAVMPFAGTFALDPTVANTDDSATVNLSYTIAPAIALSVDETSKAVSKLDVNSKDETLKTTATVSTNENKGFTLSVTDSDTDTTLKNANNDTINTGTTIAEGTSAWGIKSAANGSEEDTYQTAYAALPALGGTAVVVNTHTGTAADNKTDITYGVSTSKTQATGIYTGGVTYTAAVRE